MIKKTIVKLMSTILCSIMAITLISTNDIAAGPGPGSPNIINFSYNTISTSVNCDDSGHVDVCFADNLGIVNAKIICTSLGIKKPKYRIKDSTDEFVTIKEGDVFDTSLIYDFYFSGSEFTAYINFTDYSSSIFEAGDNQYNSLYEAVADSSSNTIKLILESYNFSNEGYDYYDLTDKTLDLNGNTLMNNGNVSFEGTNITIKNGKMYSLKLDSENVGETSATIIDGYYRWMDISKNAKLDIKGGCFDLKYNSYINTNLYEFVDNKDETTKDEFKYKVVKKQSFSVNGIKYSTFSDAITEANKGTKAIFVEDTYNLDLDDSDSFNLSGITLNLGDGLLSGTDYNFIGTDIKLNGKINTLNLGDGSTSTSATITDGYYDAINVNNASLNIIGGYFPSSIDLSNYIDNSHWVVANDDPTYTQKVESRPVTSIGTNRYDSLQAALSVAKSGDAVVMGQKSEENEYDVLLANGITIDLNGHNLSVKSVANMGGIIKDSATEKGSLTYTSNFAYVDAPYEKKETTPGSGEYTNPYAYIPVKVDTNKYEFYEASVANVNKSDLTGDYNGKRQAVVGSAIVEKIHDKVFTSDSGVGLGLRVGVDGNDKESYSFSASIIQQYTENATTSKPYFKIVGLDNAASITINGFVTNDSVAYRYDGKAKTINLAEQLDSDPNSKGE